ncbi:hypothetical protein [Dermatophilus congolensis]|uniref:hypothetical protein n=1 Tax=Dermatophilus congolensis TaxID=1863 RepID=UPI001AAFED36|nr:hypothetical protein [Dermatophilus congolensis]MBO3129588.1 hypothetical protein [Dermatophilus congolensis]MBO3131779.1 hypothetical protein [Dermatophilus congolensis]MBO3134063.1 hypothetical protein [Dermatophilus congolensis]MBO3136296.1 hypothetical protein [Dermatophilus congolensis]MBO3138544.1 hypothetical protein [Dermatophilus congolensis]
MSKNLTSKKLLVFLAATALSAAVFHCVAARDEQIWSWELFLVSVVVVGVPVGLLFIGSIWPSKSAQKEVKRAEESVETKWFQDATVQGFWTMGFLLVWIDVLGRVWGVIPQLSPIASVHIGIVAAFSLSINYLIIRRRES